MKVGSVSVFASELGVIILETSVSVWDLAISVVVAIGVPVRIRMIK